MDGENLVKVGPGVSAQGPAFALLCKFLLVWPVGFGVLAWLVRQFFVASARPVTYYSRLPVVMIGEAM
ncbi:hypothetical protein [Gluconacetobacter johannae]|uniref:Uncharacterized protein n=1 Tax=Gluconacetobacter johannae TaxID=112140 RepID=A0A7W4J6Z7_9PROT|nr:hypothetical protein [Gluconacetobacter johannae]MBB2175759.1 hypothetical protein [Gluconacetobacter johannae]